MRRFAKPLYRLKLVPGVRIPPSPPDFRNSIQHRGLLVSQRKHFYIIRVLASPSDCTLVAHTVSKALIAFAASTLTVFT
jgi:hypothetical protein